MIYEITRNVVPQITLKEYMDNWLKLTKMPTLKPTSYDRLEQTAKYQIYPELGDKPLNDSKRIIPRTPQQNPQAVSSQTRGAQLY